jgi:hypothetical protein
MLQHRLAIAVCAIAIAPLAACSPSTNAGGGAPREPEDGAVSSAGDGAGGDAASDGTNSDGGVGTSPEGGSAAGDASHPASAVPDAGKDAARSEAAPDAGGDATPASGGTPIVDSRCVGATTDTVFITGLGGLMNSTLGGDLPTLDTSVGFIGNLTITAPSGGDMSVVVSVGNYASPGLMAGGTYPLAGTTYVIPPGGTATPIPVVQITEPNGAICNVTDGSLTINKLVLASNGYDVQEAQVSWTGMSCVISQFSPTGLTTTATGPGCFHVF